VVPELKEQFISRQEKPITMFNTLIPG